jgi:hypothetical protein
MTVSKRIVQFPQNVPFGTTHYEHGRTWEFVDPGMWKSVGGSGSGGGGGTADEIEWNNILNKPAPILNLAGESARGSIVSGGNY